MELVEHCGNLLQILEPVPQQRHQNVFRTLQEECWRYITVQEHLKGTFCHVVDVF